MPATVVPTSIEIADVGPTTSWGEEPGSKLMNTSRFE
jgi:hypothetical protein